MQNNIEYKIVFIGSQNVGKTSLIQKKKYNTFRNFYAPTYGASYSCISQTLDNTICDIHIWDTSGQSRFRELLPIYYNDAHCIIIMFDLSKKESFLEAIQIFKNLQLHDQTLFLIGNKLDNKEKKISVTDVNKHFNNLIQYIEISVKDNIHLNIFEKILKQNISQFIKKVNREKDGVLDFKKEKKQNRKCVIM